MSGLLPGDRVLVVGGRQGIGSVLARRLCDMGMHVTIASRSCSGADAREGIHAVRLDASDPDQVESCIVELKPRHTITTCADIIRKPLTDMTALELSRSFESKFWTQLHVALAASRHGQPRGSLTLFSGLASRLNFGGLGITGVINAAVERLTLQLAQEGRLRVNCVAPGIVEIPEGIGGHARSPEFLQNMIQALPTGRIVNAQDVASMVICIMRNEALNGATIILDSGQQAASTARP